MPVVSIILPTKNSIRFMAERVATIKAQRFTDFEVLCLDTDSTDGTREFILQWAKEDKRVRLIDVPPGLYKALNFGVRTAQGKFIYFAMSDDTMYPDALAEMVAALDRNPDCGICDSRLVEIGENSEVLQDGDEKYTPCFGHLFFDRTKELVRRPPFDFYLHCCGRTVYTSLTQILIRKSVFDEIGYFPEDRGVSADYYWGMKASMTTSVIYLPKELATWRLHDTQLTGHDSSFLNFELMKVMAKDVIAMQSDLQVKRTAQRLNKIVGFKTLLLPIKRDGRMFQKVYGLVVAIVRYPGFSARFALALLRTWLIEHDPHPKLAAYCLVFRQLLLRCAPEILSI